MALSKVEPYGSWESPITSDLIVSSTIGLGQIAIDGEDVYWIEMRPSEGGRNVIVRRSPDGQTRDVTPAPFNVRSRVHEYGGGSFFVTDGTVYFSNFADQRLYRQHLGETPQPLTPEADRRYADGIIDLHRQQIVCVCEDHSVVGREAANMLVSINLNNSQQVGAHGRAPLLVSGSDFYSSPRLSPDGSCLAWLSWNHPNMPWDGTQLWVGKLAADGLLVSSECVAGGENESIFQPEWSPDGTLYFVSDRSGWWNIHRFSNGVVEPVLEMAAEFGLPHWVFQMSTYGFESADRIVCTYTERGIWHLASLDTKTSKLELIETPYSEVSSLQAAAGRVVFLGGSPTEPTAVVQIELTTQQKKSEVKNLDFLMTVLRRSSQVPIDTGYLSNPQAIAFPTTNGQTAYAFFYPPQNSDCTAPKGDLPPLRVKSHGGPTAAASSTFNLSIQYWTSRGIAVLDVNYGGSTGYGRAYRERLDGQWGVVDVDDCVNGAKYLVEQGLVDGDRLAIAGGSAGGYTTLCALTFRDTFKAGASYYGVSDLEALARDTHKFESRYLDRLIAPYPDRRLRVESPQQNLYYERSPIHFTDRLSCPVIFFQGLEDKIVPPNQAEMMVEALRLKGVPVAYLPFPEEQHGFRRSENIKRSLEGELYFYSRVFGFKLAVAVEPVLVENLKAEN